MPITAHEEWGLMNPSFIHVHRTFLILLFQDTLLVIRMALWDLGRIHTVLVEEMGFVSITFVGQLATTCNPSFSECNILLWPQQIHTFIYTIPLPHILILKAKRKWEWSFENTFLADKIPYLKKQPNEVKCEPPILTTDRWLFFPRKCYFSACVTVFQFCPLSLLLRRICIF